MKKTMFRNLPFLEKKGTKLPKKYFLDEFRIFYKKFPNFKYLVISDNTELAKKIFITKKNIFFSNLNLYEDLAIISKCKYGVLSNSHFHGGVIIL